MLAAGCAHFKAYREWQLAPEAKEPSSAFRIYRSGHLLQHGPGFVLEVNRLYPGNLFVMDDERCIRAWVEIPGERDTELISVRLQSPRAFLQRCNCAWGQCTEESLTSGTVELSSTSGETVKAKLSLRFPSKTIRASARFQVTAPHWTALWDDAESAQQREVLEREMYP
jgi:hypothetical protein